MSTEKKKVGVLPKVNTSALGKLMGGLLMGDTNAIVDAFKEGPEETEAEAAARITTHEPDSPACEFKDSGYHCAGHNSDGHCIMAKDA